VRFEQNHRSYFLRLWQCSICSRRWALSVLRPNSHFVYLCAFCEAVERAEIGDFEPSHQSQLSSDNSFYGRRRWLSPTFWVAPINSGKVRTVDSSQKTRFGEKIFASAVTKVGTAHSAYGGVANGPICVRSIMHIMSEHRRWRSLRMRLRRIRSLTKDYQKWRFKLEFGCGKGLYGLNGQNLSFWLIRVYNSQIYNVLLDLKNNYCGKSNKVDLFGTLGCGSFKHTISTNIVVSD
jgi:hypothetical protein